MSELLELVIERPVAGGRMIARDAGRIVFVAGAVPGERVRARVERRTRQAIFATVIDVIDPSADRREPPCDPACGGLAFAHIAYERQLALKGEILEDAFRRIARTAIEPPAVAASPERGYRLRARLHVRDGRAGFFREGTHELCDAASTGQLRPAVTSAIEHLLGTLGGHAALCDAVVAADNIAGTECVLHIEPHEHARLGDLGAVALPPACTGVTTTVRDSLRVLAGDATLTDTAAQMFGADPPVAPQLSWTRHAPSFFQGNRFLTGLLVRQVLAASPGQRVVDLYSGVGLFALALAARGGEVLAVEGDPSAGSDLESNAAALPPGLRVVRQAVETVVRTKPEHRPDVVVLDPPRTGVSPAALEGLLAWRAPRLVYVSCDPPTLARDAAALIRAGYALASISALDLFPNTPHIEALAVFTRSAAG